MIVVDSNLGGLLFVAGFFLGYCVIVAVLRRS